MRRILFLLFAIIPVLASGQVVNFAKTLPERAFSVGLAPAYHLGENVFTSNEGPAVAITGGYGLLYSLDIGARYIYFANGADYFGIDMQYLLHEARQSYFSAMAGLHKWDQFGIDLTGLYTYTPRYLVHFSVGLDFDLSFASELNPRFWVPLNAGLNVNEMMFVYLEYNLPVSERAWDIVALGINLIIR